MNAALLDLALSEVRVQEQVREDEARRTQQYIDVVGELESQLLDLQCRSEDAQRAITSMASMQDGVHTLLEVNQGQVDNCSLRMGRGEAQLRQISHDIEALTGNLNEIQMRTTLQSTLLHIEAGLHADVVDDLRGRMEEGLREEVRAELRTELEADMRATIGEELQAEVFAALRAGMESEIAAEVEATLRAELLVKFRAEMEVGMRAEVETGLRAEIEAGLLSEVEMGLRAELEMRGEHGLYSPTLQRLQQPGNGNSRTSQTLKATAPALEPLSQIRTGPASHSALRNPSKSSPTATGNMLGLAPASPNGDGTEAGDMSQMQMDRIEATQKQLESTVKLSRILGGFRY